MEERSAFERKRQSQLPPLPSFLQRVLDVHFVSAGPIDSLQEGKASSAPALRVGVLFSGGPAPGGHNVIAGLYDALKELHSESVLIGFLNGPKGVLENEWKTLHQEEVNRVRNQGGFDLIGTGRDKIETEAHFALAAKHLKDLDGLVIIGGDDSNTNAAHLAEYFLKTNVPTKILGVPKTIDGDLRAPGLPISFGFDTACKTYAAQISNLQKDALSSKKYYHFVKLMGRSASHIVLECALLCRPDFAVIGEEKRSLKELIKQIVTLIEKRHALGSNFGVILLPEGLLEFVPEMKTLLEALNQDPNNLPEEAKKTLQTLPEKVQKQLLLDRDPHGNIRLSQVDTQELVIELVRKELSQSIPFYPVSHFFGYEGRCTFPSLFDASFTYALGKMAAIAIRDGLTGKLLVIDTQSENLENWQMGAVDLSSLLTKEVRKGKEKLVIRKALVDCDSKPFFALKKRQAGAGDTYRFVGPIQFDGETETFLPEILRLS